MSKSTTLFSAAAVGIATLATPAFADDQFDIKPQNNVEVKRSEKKSDTKGFNEHAVYLLDENGKEYVVENEGVKTTVRRTRQVRYAPGADRPGKRGAETQPRVVDVEDTIEETSRLVKAGRIVTGVRKEEGLAFEKGYDKVPKAAVTEGNIDELEFERDSYHYRDTNLKTFTNALGEVVSFKLGVEWEYGDSDVAVEHSGIPAPVVIQQSTAPAPSKKPAKKSPIRRDIQGQQQQQQQQIINNNYVTVEGDEITVEGDKTKVEVDVDQTNVQKTETKVEQETDIRGGDHTTVIKDEDRDHGHGGKPDNGCKDKCDDDKGHGNNGNHYGQDKDDRGNNGNHYGQDKEDRGNDRGHSSISSTKGVQNIAATTAPTRPLAIVNAQGNVTGLRLVFKA